MAKQKVLTLVKNTRAKLAYPKTDADYDVLRDIGISVRYCSADFLPLLSEYAKTKKVKLDILLFEEVENKALETLQRKWPGQFDRNKNRIVLSCPRDNHHKKIMGQVNRALKKFYATHGQKLEYQIKRGSKNVKVTFTVDPTLTFLSEEK